MRIFKRLKILISIIVFSLGSNLWAVVPDGTNDLGNTYWTNNTGGNTVNGFDVTLSSGVTRNDSSNSFYFDSTTFESSNDYYAIVTFTADDEDLGTFDLDYMNIENFGNDTIYLDFSASNGETFRYTSASSGIVKVDIDETVFNNINWFKVKIIVVNNSSVNNMDLKLFKLTDLKAPSSDTAPTASSVSFSGTLQDGQTLTGAYTYGDAESDAESGTTFKWYVSTDSGGAGKTAISGATSQNFTLTSSEVGKYISFEVTPKNANATGSAVESDINSTAVGSSAPAQDSDATLTAGSGVDESSMIPLPSTVNTLNGKVDLFDFKITDGGTSDDFTTDVTQIVINVSGSTDDTVRGQIKWILNGTDVSDKEGTYSSGTITFSSLGISVPKGGSETYKLSAYFDVQSGLTDNATFTFSINGSSDVTVNSNGTKMATGQSAITNGGNAKVDITATKLMFHAVPSNIDLGP